MSGESIIADFKKYEDNFYNNLDSLSQAAFSKSYKEDLFQNNRRCRIGHSEQRYDGYSSLFTLSGESFSFQRGVIVFNCFTAPKIINRKYELQKKPLVSILIPARNEEDTIAELLQSIIQQSYSNYRTICLG